MTLDELILEGKSFEITYEEAHLEPAGFGMAAQIPGKYYLSKGDNDSLHSWIQKCRRFIALNFQNDIASEYFNAENTKNITDRKLYEMIGALEAIKEMPTICPKKEETPTTLYNINQTQTQTQSQNLEFVLSHLSEEFSEEQIAKIEDVVKSSLPKGSKRQNILELLKNFGVSVGANLITSMLIG